MPAFAWKLDDAQIAAVATYVRNSWGNAAPAVHGRRGREAARASCRTRSARRRRHPQAGRLAASRARHAGPADTDSRDNGTARAGSAAGNIPLIPATHEPQGGAAPAGSGSGGGGSSGTGVSAPAAKPQGGHSAGTPGPG